MRPNLVHLLKSRRFLPLFATQFLGALNDNLFKQALILLVVFGVVDSASFLGQIADQVVVIAGGIFILPFFLFSATAGQLADKYEKSALIRRIKLAEIGIMLLAAIGFLLDPAFITFKIFALVAVLFFMGIQSTFFGPLKYAILPAHLREEELVGGNGLVEAATFLAILIGTIFGGLLILREAPGTPLDFGPFLIAFDGKGIVSLALLGVAVFGWAASWFIPKAAAADPGLKVRRNILIETGRVVGHARRDRRVFLAILGISWFWLVGFTFMSFIGPFVKDVLGAEGEVGTQVTTFLLTLFSVGIGVGSLLTNRMLKGEISARYVPIGALGISFAAVALYFTVRGQIAPELLGNFGTFIADPINILVTLELTAIAVFGGIYIVPLYAIMQHFSEQRRRARVIAGNNILNALFIVASALVSAAMLTAGFSVPEVFLTIAVLNFGVALYICRLLPDAVVKPLVAGLLRLLFKVEVKGLENYDKIGPRTLIIANHVSWIDGLLLATFLPDKPTFAIDTNTAKKWWASPFLSLVNFHPMDPTNPFSTKSLIAEVRKGVRCVIFPEGRLTVTGSLMKVYEGPGMIADKAEADVLPIRIDGAQFCKLSRLKGTLRLRWFPKITLTILPPCRFEVGSELRGRRRREVIGAELYEVMCDLVFQTCDYNRPLFQALVDAVETHGPKAKILGDPERPGMTYRQLLRACFAAGNFFARITQPGENVGVALPSATGTAITILALQARGRVPAMINFSSGATAMEAACKASGIRHIVTSRRFLEASKLTEVVAQLGRSRTVHYLDDLKEEMGVGDRLIGILGGRWAEATLRWLNRRRPVSAEDAAVVLFTSGSEGLPKAVVLSHRNLLANAFQLGARVDFNPTDRVFNALPLFHSFGLSSGLILPLVSGVPVFLYPSPLHYRIIPEMIYSSNATILFGTDTFLAGYARVAHAYDFYSLRYVFSGAERVKESTRNTWIEKFGLRILEGYGATETSPVISANTPMHYRAGTVGRMLPGMRHRLEPVPGIEEGGRLWVEGPNVMKGYYRVDKPLELEPPKDGWYDTGDIVEFDADGFITIKGRAKRFAKIAGEMVSLGAVEEAANRLWPDADLAVVALPDERKGEQLVLLTSHADPRREDFLAHAQAGGLPELLVPRQIFGGCDVPLLGSGKTDYPGATELAADLIAGRLPGLATPR